MLSQSRFVLEIVNQASLYACVPRESSVPTELALGHLRCRVTDMPPQPNSPSGRCLETRLPSTPEGDRLAQNSPRSRAHEVIQARRQGLREGANAKKPRPRRCAARRRTQAIGLTIRLVKQRPKWWYFICACAATYTTPRVSPHRSRLESNSTGSSFPA